MFRFLQTLIHLITRRASYNPEDEFEESGFEYEENNQSEEYYPEDEYASEELGTKEYGRFQSGSENSGYSNATASLTDADEMSALDAISWFSRIEDKGIMTDMERVYINSIVRSLGKVLLSGFTKKGLYPRGHERKYERDCGHY